MRRFEARVRKEFDGWCVYDGLLHRWAGGYAAKSYPSKSACKARCKTLNHGERGTKPLAKFAGFAVCLLIGITLSGCTWGLLYVKNHFTNGGYMRGCPPAVLNEDGLITVYHDWDNLC